MRQRHPDTGRYTNHEAIAEHARANAIKHHLAAQQADAEARDHSRRAQLADAKGDRGTALKHHEAAVEARARAQAHRDLASSHAKLETHHRRKVEPPEPLGKRDETQTVVPLTAEKFFKNFGY